VDIRSLGLELSETVGDGSQSLPGGFQVIQGLFQSEVVPVVAGDLPAQEGSELLVHAEHGILGAGAQYVMAMFHPFQDGGEFASDSLAETKAEHLRELFGGEAE